MQITHELILTQNDYPFKLFDFHAFDLTRSFPFHWHQSTELLFCLEGSLNVKFINKEYILSKNDVIVINPNIVHETKSTERNWILCIQLPLKFLKSLTFGEYSEKFLFNLNTVKDRSSNSAELQSKLQLLTKIENSKDNYISKNIQIFSLLLNTINFLFNNYKQVPENSNSNEDLKFINLFIQFINQHYSEKITLHDVALHFSYSDTYCSKLIRNSLGITFKSFLNSVRVNQSINLMSNSKMTMSEIAEKCGFSDYRNLYNAFHALYNVSPTNYRQTIINNI
ncbi:AraC family transcriptional regulator [Liquorilactobacillus mali]|uniref:AraC family transcriptional regulator n=1 Tax=Liquorilactobacillus mali TaxID=1618 RepID=UPI00264E87C4|nr:AraC family transcriptional regulator [Liquorilactobacillus mali]MDN7145112.1 AraC family transcriptional regulator [Liquorilactobacillus mali]